MSERLRNARPGTPRSTLVDMVRRLNDQLRGRRDITVLRGSLLDEAALHGILIKVRDVARPRLAVSRVQDGKKSD